MDNSLLSRSYLETLSTSDLIALADDYGIDIPQDLNRRFIIAELLEAIEDLNDTNDDDLIPTDKNIKILQELPYTYNESQINIVLRNPAWCFVYWDIRSSDLDLLYPTSGFIKLLLKVSFFDLIDSSKPKETFDVPLATETREQYVFIPSNENYLGIDLVAEFGNREPLVIASSKKIAIPQGCPEISSNALTKDVAPILELSGFNKLLQAQYAQHRQSFI